MHKSPHAKLTPVPTKWTEGFWADRFTLCHETIIPSMREALAHPDNSADFRNFRIAAGLEQGDHHGTNWSDGDCYKWMEAMSHVYGVTKDPELDRELDELIKVIAKAQEDNGYICTQVQLTDKEPWTLRFNHELYNFGHLLTSACVHHQVTGKDNFLNVAVKAADHLYQTFQPRPKELAHFGWNPSNIMGLVDMYRETGDEKYLELAGIFVDMRGSQPVEFPTPEECSFGDQNQDRTPLREETQAVGHAVTAAYLYAGAADAYAETGEEALLDALERIWTDVVTRKMYITGAIGAFHHTSSPNRDSVHEAFGLSHQLPNAIAYNETCADIGNAMWNQRMLQLNGEARFADVMEQVIYNSGLSGMSIDGTKFCYTNPLRWHADEHEYENRDPGGRWFTHSCYCCPPQVARTIARMHNWAYSTSDNAVWVHLYGGNEFSAQLPTGTVKLQQKTNYPWDGVIEITVEDAPPEPVAINLRIPGWSKGTEIKINGEPADVTEPGTYTELQQQWSAGDTITVEIPMPVRLVESHPMVEETRNQLAVMRGPIVYCLEAADLPDDVSVSEIYLTPDIELTPEHRPDLLAGVTVLTGQACRRHKGDWGNKLYRDKNTTDEEPADITLIPYYAWRNRGEGAMSVWLPVR